MPILKLASSDLNDWVLIEKIATHAVAGHRLDGRLVAEGHRRPRHVLREPRHPARAQPLRLAVPERGLATSSSTRSTTSRTATPTSPIGFSTHEYQQLGRRRSLIAYAKGARTFERHIDIEADGIAVSPYCSLPEQVDTWFKAFHKAKEMCGGSGRASASRRTREIEYLDGLVRGVYAAPRPAAAATRSPTTTSSSRSRCSRVSSRCRELFRGEALAQPVVKHGRAAHASTHLDNPYSRNRAPAAT